MSRNFITNPDAFISERVTKRSASVEVVLVLLVGGLGLLGPLYLGLEMLDVSDAPRMSMAVAGAVIRPVAVTLGLWLGYSVLFHLASRFFNARGRLRRLFTGAAWAFLPMGIGNLVQSAAFYVVVNDLTLEDYLDAPAATDQLTGAFAAVMSDPLVIGASVVFLGTVAWSAYLMTFVLENVKTNLSYDDAVKLAAVVFGIQILLAAWALFTGTRSFALLL